jgi:uncharacterized membrane protein (DUF106 family)
LGGIEIGKAIDAYGIAIITGILLGLIVWLVKHFVTQQDNTMKEIIGMSKVEMKAIGTTMEKMQKTIQKDGSTNARLNRKSITMIGNLAEYLNTHLNGNKDKVNFEKKVKENGRK